MDTSRIIKLREHLHKNQLDAVLISSIPNIIYLTDFSYFSADEREAYILVTQQHTYLFTDARYSHAVKTKLPHCKLVEISAKHSFEDSLKRLITKEKIAKLGIEEQNLVVHEHRKITALTETTHFSLARLRKIKDHEEIQAIQKACLLGDKAFAFILKKIKPGMTEKDIAFLLETFIRKKGADIAFPTIVAFGKNAAVPHHKTSDQRLTTNDLILLDFGVMYQHYCSDMTRTVFVGKAAQKQKHVYEIVLEAQNKAIKFIQKYCHAGRQILDNKLFSSDIDKAAREYILKKGYPTIPHSLGHGIGLQVHESPTLSPKSRDILQDGMVFSIEPGIYLPGKFGVRIEDLFTIQNNTLIQLTKSPRNLIER